MKRSFLLLLFILILSNVRAQKSQMDYFLGKWDFSFWSAGNKSRKPDRKAVWVLERNGDKIYDASGNVFEDGKETTKELISYDSGKRLYSRVITSKDGLYFFVSKGWEGEKLVWEGHLTPLSDQKIFLKEEITKISEKEFRAVFYKKAGEEWIEISREELRRRG